MENKRSTIFAGAMIGAFTGMIAAILLNRRAERNERTNAISAGEGLKIGVLLFGLLRAISSLDDQK